LSLTLDHLAAKSSLEEGGVLAEQGLVNSRYDFSRLFVANFDRDELLGTTEPYVRLENAQRGVNHFSTYLKFMVMESPSLPFFLAARTAGGGEPGVSSMAEVDIIESRIIPYAQFYLDVV
jgi:hypothetical protein